MAALKKRTYEYDFAVEAGAIGTIQLTRGYPLSGARNGGKIPVGAEVVLAVTTIVTDLTNAANATIKVVVPGVTTPTALDVVAPDTLDATEVFLSTMPAAWAALTVADNPTVIIATAAVTAGKFRLVVYYNEP